MNVDKKRYFFLALIAIISFLPLFSVFPLFQQLSFGLDDFSSQIFYILNKKTIASDKIVVVEIDDYSLKQIAQSWPLRRSLYAEALSVLNKEQAAIAGFDFVFSGEAVLKEDDEAFAVAIKNFKGKVVLGYFWDKSGLHLPKKEFREYAALGFINSIYDIDGVERRSLGFAKFNDSSDVSFAIKVVSAYKNYSKTFMAKIVPELGMKPFTPREAGVKEQYVFDINYLVKPNNIRTLALYDLINHNFPDGMFKNKIVIIGPTLGIAHDIHPTPLGVMPGVFIHGNIIVSMLSGKLMRAVSSIIVLFAVMLIFILIAYVLRLFTYLRGILLNAGIMLSVFWLNIVLSFYNWHAPIGKIIVSSLIFVILLSFYKYALSVTFLIKVKNKLRHDPLSGLFNTRYFCERLYFDLKGILRKQKYITVIALDGYTAYSKTQDFEQVKEMWKAVAGQLFSVSSLWTRYSEEIICGVLANQSQLEPLKKILQEYFSTKGIRVKTTVAPVNIHANVLAVVEFLISELKKSASDMLILKSSDFPEDISHNPKYERQVDSLYLDVEDKNTQLLKLVEQLKNEELKTKEAYFELMSSLITALESKDAYTKGHTQRVCNYSIMLAQKLKLSEEEKERIRKAAILHDIGKIGVSDNILLKKGKLTDEEFMLIKEHARLGAKILEPIKEFKEIIPYILYHHENFDGSGYPHGLAADFIPLGARIIAVADMFDALTTGRVYKQAFSTEEAVREIEGAKGKKLDPVLADKFIEALRDFHILSST